MFTVLSTLLMYTCMPFTLRGRTVLVHIQYRLSMPQDFHMSFLPFCPLSQINLQNYDEFRQLVLMEPRGYPCQNADIVYPSAIDGVDYGYVILEQNKVYVVDRLFLSKCLQLLAHHRH